MTDSNKHRFGWKASGFNEEKKIQNIPSKYFADKVNIYIYIYIYYISAWNISIDKILLFRILYNSLKKNNLLEKKAPKPFKPEQDKNATRELNDGIAGKITEDNRMCK